MNGQMHTRVLNSTLFELCHEQTCFLHAYAKKGTDELHGNRAADQHLCFRYIESAIPLLPKYKISSL